VPLRRGVNGRVALPEFDCAGGEHLFDFGAELVGRRDPNA